MSVLEYLLLVLLCGVCLSSSVRIHRSPDVKQFKHYLIMRSHFLGGYERSGNYLGPLIAFNLDIMLPNSGHTLHPHAEVEIISYIIDGYLTHEDTAGRKETLGRGSAQVVTAGTGLKHTEMNHNLTKDLLFVQMWMIPRKYKLNPATHSRHCNDPSERIGVWKQLVVPAMSQEECPDCIPVHQNASMYATELQFGQSIVYTVPTGRQIYVLVAEGNAGFYEVNWEEDFNSEQDPYDRYKEKLHQADAVEAKGPIVLSFGNIPIQHSYGYSPNVNTHLLLMDLPKTGKKKFNKWWKVHDELVAQRIAGMHY